MITNMKTITHLSKIFLACFADSKS